jgi:hypothetical protein
VTSIARDQLKPALPQTRQAVSITLRYFFSWHHNLFASDTNKAYKHQAISINRLKKSMQWKNLNGQKRVGGRGGHCSYIMKTQADSA